MLLNIPSGRPTSINQLARTIGECAGVEVEVERLAPRAGDVLHSCADIVRARAVLGFEPRVDLKEGLRMTFAAFGRDAALTGGGATK